MNTPSNERNREILRIIILEFIDKGEPVGSRRVSKLTQEKLSPATIRNVMADLEETGFLYQPHTSAGRVPTDQAYRFYVDAFDAIPPLPAVDKKFIDGIFARFSGEVDRLLQITPKWLSYYSGHIGIVMRPRVSSIVLRRIKLVRVRQHKILALIVSQSGAVYERMISVDAVFTQDELDGISKYLVDQFRGFKLTDIRNKIEKMIEEEQSVYDKLIKHAIYFSQKSFGEDLKERDLYLHGTLNIVEYPEFADIKKMKNLFRTLEEKGKLLNILNRFIENPDMKVTIGSENKIRGFEDCSIIAGNYHYKDTALGTVAILGPTRMKYSKSIALVDYISKTLSCTIS